MRVEGYDPAGTVMVGDRLHDIEAAKANGLRSIGVLWGYGGREELERVGADGWRRHRRTWCGWPEPDRRVMRSKSSYLNRLRRWSS